MAKRGAMTRLARRTARQIESKQRTKETRPSIDQYINRVSSSLPASGRFYFPVGKANRKRMNLRLGREIGYGLKDYSPEEVRKILGTLYSRLIVKNSLDSTGVALNNSDFLSAIKNGMR